MHLCLLCCLHCAPYIPTPPEPSTTLQATPALHSNKNTHERHPGRISLYGHNNRQPTPGCHGAPTRPCPGPEHRCPEESPELESLPVSELDSEMEPERELKLDAVRLLPSVEDHRKKIPCLQGADEVSPSKSGPGQPSGLRNTQTRWTVMYPAPGKMGGNGVKKGRGWGKITKSVGLAFPQELSPMHPHPTALLPIKPLFLTFSAISPHFFLIGPVLRIVCR